MKRISVGSSLARAAYGEFFRAAQAIQQDGNFAYAERALPFQQLNDLFKG